MKSLRVALAQINLTVGDIGGNADKIIHYIQKAGDADADIVIFPELAITGYPDHAAVGRCARMDKVPERAVRTAFENYDLSFLVHASIEKNRTLIDHWLEQGCTVVACHCGSGWPGSWSRQGSSPAI